MSIRPNGIRQIHTQDVEQLVHFNQDKRRTYTQLKPGEFNANYVEVNLGALMLFREQLNIATRIEAAPPSSYVPFASIISPATEGYYYGKLSSNPKLIQASGGDWGINVNNHIDYVASIFNRQALYQHFLSLTGQDIPQAWLSNQAVTTDSNALNRYTLGIQQAIKVFDHQPQLLHSPLILKLYAESLTNLAIDALMPTAPIKQQLAAHSQRIRGVHRVIDYLRDHVQQLPTMAELCVIAGLSERSLQYGFKELVGISPTRYVRILRLNRVRSALRQSDHSDTKVSDIALDWGFLELGRFSVEYRQFFNEQPSMTLQAQRIS
ncbi:helix-turn-helix domain-containing protein [Shewanella sp. Scap07]|uniref:helix-turn-helix domain-containing protein n=1 Tax=Shewanella sp. Scap07 TaxID=2589987 RepID=UPI0015C0B8C8|nr:helix-turn-helix domain-containing protein [Shewanella sp. Scap07]